MSAIRLPLMCAFVGGCLSTAVLFNLWRTEAGASVPAAKQRASSHVELVSAAIAAPSAEQQPDLTTGAAAERERTEAGEPASQATQDADNAAPSPAGSAVADVLMDLEAAYRARVAAAAPARTPSPQERAAAAPPDEALAPPGPPPEAPPQPVAAALPIAPAPAAPPAPVAAQPAAVAAAPFAPGSVAPTEAPPPVAAAPAFVGQDDSRPTEVHIGDVNQNTYITNVRQGDVYLIQPQQLAVLQYMQMLGMSSGLAAPARHGRGAGAQSAPSVSTITNPDNPWGFHFTPPHLVH